MDKAITTFREKVLGCVCSYSISGGLIDALIKLFEEELDALVEERYKKELAISDGRWKRAEELLRECEDRQ